jgi:hypothetical protein
VPDSAAFEELFGDSSCYAACAQHAECRSARAWDGYCRYLKTISEEHFAIDPAKVEEEQRFDGIFVLRTNTELDPLEALLCYKQLWTVEQTIRTAKDLFAHVPQARRAIRGHVFCSFLALVLKKALEDRIAALGRSGCWPEITADLVLFADGGYQGPEFQKALTKILSPPRN